MVDVLSSQEQRDQHGRNQCENRELPLSPIAQVPRAAAQLGARVVSGAAVRLKYQSFSSVELHNGWRDENE